MTKYHAIPNNHEAVTAHGLYITRAAARGLRVPAWVPSELIAEYVDCAKEYGADHAVKHIDKIMEDLGYE